jgi:4-hydroxybenzoate polyprenyltransferase
MPNMIALLVATLNEAQPLLALLKAEQQLTQPFPVYGYPGGLVAIIGMGPKSAAKAADYVIRNGGASTIINFGICGALSESFKPGGLCRVITTLDGDALLQSRETSSLPLLSHEAWQHFAPVRLASVTEPVFGGEPRQQLAAHADIVDMEGYAVAQAARRHGIPCYLLKVVSDLADDSGRAHLMQNLARVSEVLTQEVVKGLEQFSKPKSSMLVRMANFIKVEHTIFSLPLLFAGAWIGAHYQWPGLKALILVTLAGLGARTLGMAMNRILDHRLDSLNPRTRTRDLPSGKLTSAQAWGVAAAGLGCYLLACAALGPVCLKLSPLPALVLISYSLLKRFTPLCHFGIGLSLALGPLGAHVAVTGGTTAPPALLLLTLFTFCWIIGSDILYALQDLASDRETGVHSIPVSFGPTGARWIAAGVHLVALASAFGLWVVTGIGVVSGVALAVTGIALATMYWERLPLAFRFFPVSAIAGIAGALIPLLKELK